MLYLEMKFEYDDERTAESVMRSVEPDNAGYVESELVGKAIIYKIKAEDAGSMRNTADDLLVCIKIAEEALGLVVSRPDLDSDSLGE